MFVFYGWSECRTREAEIWYTRVSRKQHGIGGDSRRGVYNYIFIIFLADARPLLQDFFCAGVN